MNHGIFSLKALLPLLVVLPLAGTPSISIQPGNRIVSLGASTTFSVTATAATGQLSYQWFKRSAQGPAKDVAITGATSSSYTVPAAMGADNGTSYYVRVTDASGYVQSNTASLTDEPPAYSVPGSYVTTLKGIGLNGVPFVRLGFLTFQRGATPQAGEARLDYWYWQADLAADDSVESSTVISQYNPQPSSQIPAPDPEMTAHVIGSNTFLNQPLNTIYGAWNWTAIQTSDLVQPNGDYTVQQFLTIAWTSVSNGSETWMLQPQAPGSLTQYPSPQTLLYEIQLYNASFSEIGGTFANCSTAGWGFGCAGTGFSSASTDFATTTQMQSLNLSGGAITYNAWLGQNQPFTPNELNIREYFSPATYNPDVLRYADSTGMLNDYYYLTGVTDSAGDPARGISLRRMVAYQFGRDWINYGSLDDPKKANYGHIYSGLQVMDLGGNFRGFVFAEVSPANFNAQVYPANVKARYTLSAAYYIN